MAGIKPSLKKAGTSTATAPVARRERAWQRPRPRHCSGRMIGVLVKFELMLVVQNPAPGVGARRDESPQPRQRDPRLQVNDFGLTNAFPNFHWFQARARRRDRLRQTDANVSRIERRVSRLQVC